MRIALFLGFLAVAICYAAWRGGGPERVMAAIAAAMVGLDQLLHAFVPPNFLSLDSGHLAIDLFGGGRSPCPFWFLRAYLCPSPCVSSPGT